MKPFSLKRVKRYGGIVNIGSVKETTVFFPKTLKLSINPSSLIFLTYTLVQVVLLLFHEPWRDEVSPWLQTEDSTWSEVIYRSQLEIQSPLFFSILKLLHILSDSFFVYRMFLLLLSIGSALIIKKLCNDCWPFLVLVYSNYYVIYEYSVIQRIYTVSLFALLLFFYCLRKDLSSGKSISAFTKISLMVLSLVSIWTLMLSATILLTLIVYKMTRLFGRLSFIFLTITSAQVLFLSISKDRDWGVNNESLSNQFNLDNLFMMITAPIRSMVFLPEYSLTGWNTNILLGSPEGKIVTLILSLSFYGVLLFLILYRRNVAILWFLSISTFAILAGLGKQRHLGQVFLLMTTIVLLEFFICKNYMIVANLKSRIFHGILILLLLLNVATAPTTLVREVKYEFTTSQNLSSDIKPGDLLIVQDSAKNTYLPLILETGEEVFSIFGGRITRESLLNSASRSIPHINVLSREFREVCLNTNPRRILLFTDWETRRDFQRFEGVLISRSGTAIVENEGRRELWLLAQKVSDVKKLCSEPYSSKFLSGLRTKAVAYGG